MKFISSKFCAFLTVCAVLHSPAVGWAGELAGRTFNRTIGDDFSFSSTYGDFAGLTYNPLSQTYYMSENKLDKIIEIAANGTLIRIIDIAGLKAAGEATTDAEGITWLYGQKYALVLEGGEEMAILTITPTTTTLVRSNVTIYDLFGDPKGVTYRASEDAIYWVSQSGPKRVVKSQINKTTGALDILWNKDVDNLPVADLADVTVFPRLSPHLLLISETSQMIMEVDVSGATAVVKSSFPLSSWPIPQAGAMAFNADANMVVVGKHKSGVPEDDFNVFVPTAPILNLSPVPRISRAYGP